MFGYDWFHGGAYTQQVEEAKIRCLVKHFPDLDITRWRDDEDASQYHGQLDTRTLIYLRDGFSYEVKEFVDVSSKSHLVLECEPADERFKVGTFVATVPFDEVARVEVFSVHATEKPDDMHQITGFRGAQEPSDHPFLDGKPPMPHRGRADS